jgi:16S rRNA (guanine966-N2)-methyltransferase
MYVIIPHGLITNLRCLTILRVISGFAKGHKLKTLKNNIARPTSDRVKESLFSIILVYVEGSNILDLYAGTGNLGIESLSRGAASATFVEINDLCCSIIKQNLIATGFDKKSNLVKSDVLKWIKKSHKDLKKFDLVFMDPPYKDDILLDTLTSLAKANIIADNCYLVAESSVGYTFPTDIKGFEFIRENKYGDTKLSHFKYKCT